MYNYPFLLLTSAILLNATYSLSQELIPYRKGDLWGFVDKNKKVIVLPKYELAQPFEYERAAVMIDKKWGYIDASGKLVILCRYQSASPFFNINDTIQANVKIDGQWINIDKMGRPKTLNFPLEKVISEEVGFVNYQIYSVDGLYGMTKYKDYYEKGKYVFGWDTLFKPKYQVLREGSNGFFIARNNKERYGVITPSDSILVPFQYDEIIYVPEDKTFFLKKGNFFGAVDASGANLIEVKYKSVVHHSNGLFRVDLSNGKIGYILNGQEYWEESPSPGSVPAKPVSAPGKK
jgi:hypothetical protein